MTKKRSSDANLRPTQIRLVECSCRALTAAPIPGKSGVRFALAIQSRPVAVKNGIELGAKYEVLFEEKSGAPLGSIRAQYAVFFSGASVDDIPTSPAGRQAMLGGVRDQTILFFQEFLFSVMSKMGWPPFVLDVPALQRQKILRNRPAQGAKGTAARG